MFAESSRVPGQGAHRLKPKWVKLVGVHFWNLGPDHLRARASTEFFALQLLKRGADPRLAREWPKFSRDPSQSAGNLIRGSLQLPACTRSRAGPAIFRGSHEDELWAEATAVNQSQRFPPAFGGGHHPEWVFTRIWPPNVGWGWGALLTPNPASLLEARNYSAHLKPVLLLSVPWGERRQLHEMDQFVDYHQGPVYSIFLALGRHSKPAWPTHCFTLGRGFVARGFAQVAATQMGLLPQAKRFHQESGSTCSYEGKTRFREAAHIFDAILSEFCFWGSAKQTYTPQTLHSGTRLIHHRLPELRSARAKRWLKEYLGVQNTLLCRRQQCSIQNTKDKLSLRAFLRDFKKFLSGQLACVFAPWSLSACIFCACSAL